MIIFNVIFLETASYRRAEKARHRPMCESRNNMYTTNDIRRVHKPKLFIARSSFKISNVMESLSLPISSVSSVIIKPSNPKNIHPFCKGWQSLPRLVVPHINMEYSHYPSIAVWMHVAFVIFAREKHDIRVGMWVNRILGSSQIICRVVDADNFVLIQSSFTISRRS